MAFSFEEVLDLAMTKRLEGVWTSMLARVLSYDDASETVQLQTIPYVYLDDEPSPMAALPSVRVCFQGGNGGGIKFKLASGDIGTVHFCARSIARFSTDGSQGDPNDARMHDLSDALFVPSNSGGAVLPTETTPDLRIYEPSGGKVALASSPRKAVARDTDTVHSGSLSFTGATVVNANPLLNVTTLTATWTPNIGAPVIQAVALTGPIVAAAVGAPAAIDGAISASSAKVTAG